MRLATRVSRGISSGPAVRRDAGHGVAATGGHDGSEQSMRDPHLRNVVDGQHEDHDNPQPEYPPAQPGPALLNPYIALIDEVEDVELPIRLRARRSPPW